MTATSDARANWPASGFDVGSYESWRDRLDVGVPHAYSIAAATCDRWAAAKPDQNALLDLTDAGPRWWTFGQVREASLRLANGLRAAGVRFGDRVAILLPQGADAAISHLATYRLGAVAVPLSVLHGPDAVAHRLLDSTARVMITDLPSWERLSGEAGLLDACTWIVSGAALPVPGALSFEKLIAGGSVDLDPVPIDAETPAVVVYTSGTTGNPKGVLHAHRVVAAHAAPIRLAHDGFPRDGDLFWSPADWAWAGGLIDCLLSSWHAGIPIVAFRGRHFDPDEVVHMMSTWSVRNTFLPATAIRLLKDAMDSGKPNLPELRSIMTGGEPVGAETAEWCRQRLGILPNEVYGQTEASCVLGNSQTLFPAKAGSLGLPYPGSTVDVLKSDGDVAAPGEVGEIAVRSDSSALFLGYWERPDATAEKVRDGWLRTGDLGRRDDDGYFWFVSRMDDIILSAGYRIGPGEIESCLAAHPAVAEAAVVGVPDPRRGEVVKAVVVTHEGEGEREQLAETLRQHVRSRLAAYEVPRIVEFVSVLPRTVTGKVMRSALRSSGSADRSGEVR